MSDHELFLMRLSGLVDSADTLERSAKNLAQISETIKRVCGTSVGDQSISDQIYKVADELRQVVERVKEITGKDIVLPLPALILPQDGRQNITMHSQPGNEVSPTNEPVPLIQPITAKSDEPEATATATGTGTSVPLVNVPASNPSTVIDRGRRYVSAANQPLLDEMLHKSDKLEQVRANITSLQQPSASTQPANTEDEIDKKAKLDAALAEEEALQSEVQELSDRLSLVTFDSKGNVDIIRRMEGGETPVSIRESTEGCVNYIVSTMAIPSEIARDARFWPQQAELYPQYGIRVGDTPLPGSVLVMHPDHPYSNDLYGHLMYVEDVRDGEIWVTDNDHPNPVKLSQLTSETTSTTIKYMYFPWGTRA